MNDVDRSVFSPRGSWDRRTLCRELATGEMTRAALGRKYGVTGQAIGAFARRHAAEIADIKAALDDAFAGLWIARKEARIAQHQADYEAAEGNEKGDHHEWIKARTAILHAVAEELGQLPPRATITVTPVTHILVGVDPEALT